MPHEFQRRRRVAEQIRRELAPIILRRAEAAHLGLLTVTAVDVSRDLRHAKIFFTALSPTVVADAESALNRQSGNLRHLLGQQLRMRFVPSLRFVYDESIGRGTRVDVLLDRIKTKEGDQGG